MTTQTLRCQCQHEGDPPQWLLPMYEPDTERPFVKHAPGECACLNKIRLYERDGKKLYLCSACCMIGDLLIEETKQ